MSKMLDPTRDRVARARRRSRALVIVALLVSLAATAITRDWAISSQVIPPDMSQSAGTGSGTSLSAMPSFATALLLGGLRGPLVMILWTSSESQKQQHDLEDFDTKIEWIRLLQPEFDTVHLFQIWNKAYNISVQMSSLQNKYTTILDALDYADKVLKDRPDDINILSQVAGIYGDKLGGSSEHVYYRRMIRKQTQTLMRLTFPAARADDFRAIATKIGWINGDSPMILNDKTNLYTVLLEKSVTDQLQPLFNGPGVDYAQQTTQDHSDNPSWRRIRLDPMLDINGNILPQYLQVRFPRPANLGADAPWYDGSQLQFLKQYQPFPYGLSTLAIAYNDYKRAQLLQSLWNERHIQSGEVVVDSRPAIGLKLWGKDEWERGRRFELRMWGTVASASDDPESLEVPSAKTPAGQPVTDDAARQGAIYSYALGARLYSDALAEFQRHIKTYPGNASVYFSHVDECLSGQLMMTADLDYVQATAATGDAQKRLLADADSEYVLALNQFIVTFMKYYVDDAVAKVAFPIDPATGQRYTRANIASANPAVLMPTWIMVMNVERGYFLDPETHQYSPGRDQFRDDREEYTQYVNRCADRLVVLRSLFPTTAPSAIEALPATQP